MKRVVRYFHTIYVFIGLTIYILRRYKKRKQYLYDLSCDTLQIRVLPEKLHRRYKKYVPVFLGIEYMFLMLTGMRFSKEQERRATLLCGITPTFDDMIDDYDYSIEQIMDVVNGMAQPTEVEARCAVAFYEAGAFEWNHYWDHTLSVQTESIHQKANGMSQEDLLQLTRDKGGISVVYGWHVITDEYGGTPVAAAAYELGAYAQLVNDIFDLYQDREAGITTLATSCSDIRNLRAIHNDFYQKMLQSLENVPVPVFNILQIKAVFVLLHAMSECALGQLLAHQNKNNGVFDARRFSREQLVFDMAKWPNRLKWGWKVAAS